MSYLTRLFPTVGPVDSARKYLSKIGGGRGGVRFCRVSGRFRKLRQSDILVAVVVVPWLCIFIACGSGTSQVSSSPQASMPAGESSQHAAQAEATRKSDSALEVEARALAWELVEKHLKFPHDSSIGWGSDCKRLNDQSFGVTGTVKAANALGAKLTHDWRVVLAVNGHDRFMPMYISIGDEELLIASDDSLARFLGQPTESEAAAEQRIDAAAAREAEFRTWRASVGDFSVRARLDRFTNHKLEGGIVTLEREDGTTVDVPLAKLNRDDADWARAEIKRRAN